MDWLWRTFPEVATGYQDICEDMMLHACNHQRHFEEKGAVLAHFLARIGPKCHNRVLKIIWDGLSNSGRKDAAAFFMSWLLKTFPELRPKVDKLAKETSLACMPANVP